MELLTKVVCDYQSMDESEGLQKLTEYLKQTRRQAETAIDNLNGQIAALVKENDKLTNVILSLQQERDHFRTQLETIQQFHSTKAIFKERDDWRALVDNIQSDRTRLHEENGELHEQLRESQAIIQDLVKQVEYFREERTHLSMQVEELEQRFHSDQNHKEPDTPTKENIQLSPVRIRDGHHIDFFPGSPRSVMRQLKFELKKAYEEVSGELTFDMFEISAHFRWKQIN